MQGSSQTSDSGAQEKVKNLTGQAQEKATSGIDRVKDQVRTQVDHRSSQAENQVRSAAESIRGVGNHLREQGDSGPARLIDQTAEKADSLADYLSNVDGKRIFTDIENFARRQPMAFAGSLFIAGFAGSRFLKASSGQRYRSQNDSSNYAANQSTVSSSMRNGS